MKRGKKKASGSGRVATVVVLLFFVLLGGGFAYLIGTDKGGGKKVFIAKVDLVRPNLPDKPPPPPKDKPPEPETQKQQTIVAPQDMAPQQAGPKGDDKPAPEGPLGVEGEGGAGSDGFGLVGRGKGGRDVITLGTGFGTGRRNGPDSLAEKVRLVHQDRRRGAEQAGAQAPGGERGHAEGDRRGGGPDRSGRAGCYHGLPDYPLLGKCGHGRRGEGPQVCEDQPTPAEGHLLRHELQDHLAVTKSLPGESMRRDNPARYTRKKGEKAWLLLLALGLAIFPAVPGAYGQPPSSLPGPATGGSPVGETAGIEALVQMLVEKGLVSREEAGAMMRKQGEPGSSGLAALTELLKAKGVLNAGEADKVAKTAAKAPPIVISSERSREEFERMAQDAARDIKKTVREEVKAEIKEEVLQETKKEIQSAAAPEWTKRIRFGGDIRLRYEGDYFNRNNAQFANPGSPTTLMNTTDNQERYRVRARLAATADINETTEVGARLSTGNTANPVTANQTLGAYFNPYSVVLDLAYLKTTPLPGLTLIGGRIANPFFFSDLVWWRDLTFEGFAGTYRHSLSSLFEGFATAGAFPIWKGTFNQSDKWLYAGQVGLDIKPRKELLGRIGVAYYDFQHTRGIANSPSYPGLNDYTAPQFQQKGNTLFDIGNYSTSPASTELALASQFRELNVTAMFDVGFWDPIHVTFLGDYVKNVGFDRAQVAALTGNPAVTAQTQGYQVGLSVGHKEIVRFPQWRVYGYYRYLQADAVIDAFTDPDFHLGGTNAKGWIVGGDFGLGKNVWLSLKWTTANEISGPPLSIDSLFLDLNARF